MLISSMSAMKIWVRAMTPTWGDQEICNAYFNQYQYRFAQRAA